MSAKWDNWAARFNSFYGLSEAQQAQLSRQLDPAASYKRAVKGLPEGLDASKLPPVLKYDDFSLVATGPIHGPRVHRPRTAVAGVKNIGTESDKDYVLVDEFGEEKLDEKENPISARPETVAFLKEFDALQEAGEHAHVPVEAEGVARRRSGAGRRHLGPPPKTKAFYPGDRSRRTTSSGAARSRNTRTRSRNTTRPSSRPRSTTSSTTPERISKLVAEKRAKLSGVDPGSRVGAQDRVDKAPHRRADRPRRSPSREHAAPPGQHAGDVGTPDPRPLLILGLGTRIAALAGAVIVLSFYLVVPRFRACRCPRPRAQLRRQQEPDRSPGMLAVAAVPSGSWLVSTGSSTACSASRPSRR